MREQAWAPPYPDGIGEDNIRPVQSWQRHASPLGIVAFAAVVALALSGLLGHERTWVAERAGTRLEIHGPETIRNGEFFEMRLSVTGEDPIDELAIGVESEIWTDMTVNTMIPAPADEASADGEFKFTFAELAPGTGFLLKVDLQVNPDIVGGNRGRITVYDGESELVSTEIAITVLP